MIGWIVNGSMCLSVKITSMGYLIMAQPLLIYAIGVRCRYRLLWENCLFDMYHYMLDVFVLLAMTLKETQTGTMKAELEDILLAISWADLSKTYFGKSNSWLYHKLDGVDGNKKPTEFSEEEKYILKGALVDLADRIRRAAERIE